LGEVEGVLILKTIRQTRTAAWPVGGYFVSSISDDELLNRLQAADKKLFEEGVPLKRRFIDGSSAR
jgi:hypothetical protein